MVNVDIHPYTDAGNVIFGKFLGPYTWDDYSQLVLGIFELTRQVKGEVAAIADMDVPVVSDTGARRAFIRFREIYDLMPSNLKLVVVVGIREPMRTLNQAFITAVVRGNPRIEFVDSMEKAEQLVNEFLHSTT